MGRTVWVKIRSCLMKNNYKKLVSLFSFIFLLFFPLVAFSKDYSCGSAVFNIEITGEYESSRLSIKAKSNGQQISLLMHSVDYINFQCVLNKKKQFKALINAHCGGTGCAEESYTIIDSKTLMLELVPVLGRNNLKLATEVLGIELPSS